MFNPKYYLNKPSFFLNLANRYINKIKFLFIISIILNILLIVYNIITDIQQTENFKIFYLHVPAAWFSIMLYCTMVLFSLNYVLTSFKINDILAYTSAKIGCFFTIITLITGSLWGSQTWGTWWEWDTRLTSSFILFLIYLLYFIFKGFLEKNFKNSFILSFICIAGFINIPILKYSVDWWNTLHQTQSINSFNTLIDISMLIPLSTIFLSYTLFICLYFLIDIRSNIIENKIEFIKKI